MCRKLLSVIVSQKNIIHIFLSYSSGIWDICYIIQLYSIIKKTTFMLIQSKTVGSNTKFVILDLPLHVNLVLTETLSANVHLNMSEDDVSNVPLVSKETHWLEEITANLVQSYDPHVVLMVH